MSSLKRFASLLWNYFAFPPPPPNFTGATHQTISDEGLNEISYSLVINCRGVFESNLNIYKYSVNWCIFSTFAAAESEMNTTYNGKSQNFKKYSRI